MNNVLVVTPIPYSRCFPEEVEWLNQVLTGFSNSPG